MNTAIETTYNTGVFSTSDEYFALRGFWRNFIAQGKHKPVPEPIFTWSQKEPVGYHQVSPLTFEHHLIYLVATGKRLDDAFSSTTTAEKWRVFLHLNVKHFDLFEGSIAKEHQEAIIQTIKNWCRDK